MSVKPTLCNNDLENGILCGGFGCVVKIKDTDTNENYAGKISIDSDSIYFLIKEYNILKKLNKQPSNPHMIQLKRKISGQIEELCDIELKEDYDLMNEQGIKLANLKKGETRKMMVMEYLSGGDLFDYHEKQLDQKQVDIDKIHNIFVQIIDAIEFCHDNGVYHLDLKLDNFVFKDKPKSILKIIDFGLAKEGKEGNDIFIFNHRLPIGTPGFYAPELFKEGEVSLSKCDIFSIGIILLTLVCNNIITESEKGLNLDLIIFKNYIIYVDKMRDFILLSRILTPELKNLLLYMIITDPNKRYTIKDIKKSEWYKGEKLSKSEIEELESYRFLHGPFESQQKSSCTIS